MDAQQVKYYALLARIGVTDAEAETLAKDVSRILDFVDTLKKAVPNIKDIKEIQSAHLDINHMREDVTVSSDKAEAIREAFPKSNAQGMLKVPKIL